jgi:hypothetical protein
MPVLPTTSCDSIVTTSQQPRPESPLGDAGCSGRGCVLPVPLARLLPLFLAFSLGCAANDATADRSDIPNHHRLFADAFVDVLGKPYPEFESLPDNEQLVRFLHAYSRDMHALLNSFMENNPTDNPELLSAMRELDDVTVREFQLHARLVAEGRFDYTESEEDVAKELRKKSAVLAGTVAEFVLR